MVVAEGDVLICWHDANCCWRVVGWGNRSRRRRSPSGGVREATTTVLGEVESQSSWAAVAAWGQHSRFLHGDALELRVQQRSRPSRQGGGAPRSLPYLEERIVVAHGLHNHRWVRVWEGFAMSCSIFVRGLGYDGILKWNYFCLCRTAESRCRFCVAGKNRGLI